MQIWGPYERRFAFRGAPGGAKDGGDGFFGLWPQNDEERGPPEAMKAKKHQKDFVRAIARFSPFRRGNHIP